LGGGLPGVPETLLKFKLHGAAVTPNLAAVTHSLATQIFRKRTEQYSYRAIVNLY